MSKFYSYCFKNRVVTTNIPSEYIVNFETVNYGLNKFKDRTWGTPYMHIDATEMERLQDKVLYPTVGELYLGAMFMNIDGRIIPVFIRERKWNDEQYYVLYPVCVPKTIVQNIHTFDQLPLRSFKVFTTSEDRKEYYKEREQKRIEKNKLEQEAYDTNNKQTPAFAFSTPKLKVVHIFKKTAKIPAKVGDIIEGKIPVIEKNANGYSSGTYAPTYTNYVTVYINGEIVKSLSPVLFQEVFTDNFVCEIVE